MPEREHEPSAADWRAEVRLRLARAAGVESDEAREEIAQHLAACYDEARAAGLPPARARERALRELHGWRQAPPPAHRGGRFAGLGLEWRAALRGLRRTPGVALVAVALFALGLGAATLLFSLVDAVLLRPYPFREPQRLVLLWEALPQAGFPKMPFSPPDFEDLRREQRSFEELGALANRRFDLSDGGAEPERVVGARAGAAVFRVLGVAPALGRAFDDAEDRRGERLALLSHGLWRRRYGADPGVVGRRIALDRVPHTVVGVMPAAFRFPLAGPAFNSEPADVWVPLAWRDDELANRGGFFNFSVVARLRPGIDLPAARAELEALAPRVQANYPAALAQVLGDVRLGLLAVPLRDEVAGPSRGLLLVLLAAGGVLLAAACASVSSLLLARALARRRELGVRAALGASRLRLLRQPLMESAALALAGATLGALLAAAGMAALPALLPVELPLAEPVRLDLQALGLAWLLALACAVLTGAAPAALGLRRDLQSELRDGRATASPARRRAQAGLVGAQIALALVLLVSAGLLGRGLTRLLGADLGFRPDPVLALSTTLPPAAYPGAGDVRGFCARLLERLRGLPTVDAAGVSTDLPLAHTEVRALQVEGRELRGEELPAVAHSWVAGSYLQTLGVRLVAGRLLDERDDDPGAPPVVVMSASAARRLWAGEDALGRRVRAGGAGRWMTVVGIVGDVKDAGLADEPRPHSYSPLLQENDEVLAWPGDNPLRTLNVTLRTSLAPADLAGSVRHELRRLDPDAALVRLRPLRDDVRAAVAPQRAAALLLGLFAASAALLAAVGLYGALAFEVAQRRREFGLRLALGADGRQVARLVARSGLRLAALGLALGLPAAWAASRALRASALAPHDWPTWAATIGLLLALAAAAAGLPAWRAARVDPLPALREE